MCQSISASVWCPHWKVFLVTRRGTNKTPPRLGVLAARCLLLSNLSRFHFLWPGPGGPVATTLLAAQSLLSVSPGVTPVFLLELASWCLSWPRCCVRLKVTVSDCEEVTLTPHSVSSVSQVL